MTSRGKKLVAVVVFAGFAMMSIVFAQRAVNMQANTMVSQPAYSGGGGSVRYSNTSSIPMRSELRHAYWKSGSTPSDIRFSYSQLGARTPGGPMRYIDYKPGYLEPKKPSGPPPRAPLPTGSIRYATPPPSSSMVSNQMLNTRMTSSAVRTSSVTQTLPPSRSRVSYALPPSQGTVRYTRY